MRVLMTTDTVGGVWTYAIDLARALAPHGVEFVIASMGAAPSDAQRHQAAGLPNVTLHDSTFKLEWMAQPWEDVARAGDWLLDLEAEFQPDVVHLNGYAHGSLPFGAPTLVVGHSCVLSWWESVKGAAAPADEWSHYRDAVCDGIGGADLVVAPTYAMMEALEHHYGPIRATRVICNGRDGSRYAPRPKEPLVLSAGRLWDEAKNVAALVAAAPRLAWPVYVAGDDQCPDGRRQATPNVQALGRLDEAELAGWYGRASIYALPARYEPFGLSALEAALSGAALVLGDIPSLREVWQDAATYVPPGDVEALIEAVNTLIEKPVLRHHLAFRARTRAAAFSLGRMASDYLATYRSLDAVHRRPVSVSPVSARAVSASAAAALSEPRIRPCAS